MKLSEAISLRDDLQTKAEQLHTHLLSCVRVVKGSQPAEKPEKLYKEVNACLKQLRQLCIDIDATCARTAYDGKPLSQMLTEQRIMSWRVRMMQETLDAAIDVQPRDGMQYEPTIDTERISKQIDTLEELKRDIDTKVQSILHITELEE